MHRPLFITVVSMAVVGCAGNRSSDEPNARIRDTTLTARDTTHPNDTLPHIREGDSARADTAGR